MPRAPYAAILRALILLGGASYVNPYGNEAESHVDWQRVWVELPSSHVALGGDLRARVVGVSAPAAVRVRIAREDDDGRALIAAMPLALDSESLLTIPCGYFSRGGTYYLELVTETNSDSTDNLVETDVADLTDGATKKGETAEDNSSVFRDRREANVNVKNDHNEAKSEIKRKINKVTDNNLQLRNKEKVGFIERKGKANINLADAYGRKYYFQTKNTDKYINNTTYNPRKTVYVSSEIFRDKRDVTVNLADADQVSERSVVSGNVMEIDDTIVKSWKFDVLWPSAQLKVTPEQIQTYPERPVMAILEFPGVVCPPVESNADFWLELLYCGHSSGGAVLCDGKNTSSHAHVLYSEQVHGFTGRRTMTLRCELFGQAGDYALTLRPAAAAGPQDLAASFIKADWSDQFVLNVHGGSVFPCGGGVRVLFQYPQCVLEGADRVRVFGRDGDRLRYVAERRVRRGQHTASFDCRLFSERYPEYCFVYVSQAVTGAVADVRMDCLPTLALSEGAAGGWGPWSAWSACPAPDHCSTRTRSRHRFCDSPPPAYGAKYCEGQAVELAACECTAPPWAGDAVGVVTEVGPRCRCGCVLHLAPAARLLAGSARACPARSFWLLQAEEGLAVHLRMEAVRLPCEGQTLRARDGDSLGSPLLASWDGPDGSTIMGGDDDGSHSVAMEISGGRHILVELRSSDTSERCAGGFLAHATQTVSARNASAALASRVGMGARGWWAAGGGARAAALSLAAAAALAALALALHSAHRTRTYHRAADKESLTDSDACSASLEFGAAAGGSRSTLLSEVVGGGVSFRRLLPTSRAKHTRLRESDTANGNIEQRDAEEDQVTDTEQEMADAASEASGASEATITPEGISSSSAPAGHKPTPSPLRRSNTVSTAPIAHELTSPPQQSVTSETTAEEMSTSVSSVSERDSCSEKDRDSAWEKDPRSESRASSSSAATLTNGWYSPALSGVCAARVRGNPKHSKESCNRRLLRSDLSLTSHPEMEIDYYDYEVNNAGSVPGSYLGMDPAFLVWIPPLEEGDIIQEIDGNKPSLYEEALPKELYPDPGSNTESPENDQPNTLKRNDKTRIDRTNIIHPLNFSITDLQNSPKSGRRYTHRRKKDDTVSIAMKELTLSKSPIRVHKKGSNSDISSSTLKRVTDTARETKPETRQANDYNKSDIKCSADDLRFADESSESSNDIKFVDDDTPDSNKIVEKFDVKV